MTRAASELLSRPGCPKLHWTIDADSHNQGLKPGEFFNHFRNNLVLTTKAGLAESLMTSAARGSNVHAFFPRCFSMSSKSEREDLILDFRRSAALKVGLLHLRLTAQYEATKDAAGYACNLDIISAVEQTLRRWCFDLDPEHLDDEGCFQERALSEDTLDAIALYSELTQDHLCSKLGTALEHPRQSSRCRFSRRNWERKAPDFRMWPEFCSHQWGTASFERTAAIRHFVDRIEVLFPQFALHGGWVGMNIWIVKPGTSSKGSGIECMNALPEILQHCDRMPNRVVQKYVERPLLLFSGRKFDIRQWVLLRSVAPLRVFLFSECYLRLCNSMYDLGDLRNKERHISNWQVNKHGRNVVEGAAVSLHDFKKELSELSGCEECWETRMIPQLHHIVLEVLRSVKEDLVPRAESFEVFGFDVMIDEDLRMWLLEVNLSPGCEGRTAFLERMLERMSKRLIEVAVLGQEEPDGLEPDWVKILDEGMETVAHCASEKRRPGTPGNLDLTLRGQALRMSPMPQMARAS